MDRDNHDKKILETLKSIAASLKSIDKTLKNLEGASRKNDETN